MAFAAIRTEESVAFLDARLQANGSTRNAFAAASVNEVMLHFDRQVRFHFSRFRQCAQHKLGRRSDCDHGYDYEHANPDKH